MWSEAISSRRARPAGRALLLLAMTTLAACGDGADRAVSDARSSSPDAAPPSSAAESAGAAAGARARPTGPAPATLAAEVAELTVPAAPGSGQPRLTTGAGGEVALSWLEPEGDTGNTLRFVRLEDGGWSAPTTVAGGDDFFANWADLPSVQPITSELWAAHWLQLAPDSFESYNVAVAISRDGGATWSPGARLNSDDVLAEHGFVSLFPWRGGVGAVWLDGRKLESAAAEDAAPTEGEAASASREPPGTTLRYGTIAADGTAEDVGEIDGLVCDCCQTGVAISADGPVVIYRDRTAEEIRDVAVRRAGADGWTAPVVLGPDGWKIDGCPVNGPAIAAQGETVAAAWFTAAGGSPRIRFARSTDGGATFGPAVDVDADGSFGYVDVVLLDDGASVVSWWRRADDDRIALTARRVEPSGALGDARVVAENDTPRPLDVPQMVRAGDRLIFAWTDVSAPGVKSAAVPLW